MKMKNFEEKRAGCDSRILLLFIVSILVIDTDGAVGQNMFFRQANQFQSNVDVIEENIVKNHQDCAIMCHTTADCNGFNVNRQEKVSEGQLQCGLFTDNGQGVASQHDLFDCYKRINAVNSGQEFGTPLNENSIEKFSVYSTATAQSLTEVDVTTTKTPTTRIPITITSTTRTSTTRTSTTRTPTTRPPSQSETTLTGDMIQVQVNWDKALSICKKSGGTLFSASTAERHQAAFDYAEAHFDVLPDIWIGLYSEPSNSSLLGYEWKWLDGQTVSYTNWGFGEPADEDQLKRNAFHTIISSTMEAWYSKEAKNLEEYNYICTTDINT